MSVCAIIPARYGSTRFPGKPLAHILGKPMIWWVVNGVSRSADLDTLIVATDDERIAGALTDSPCRVLLSDKPFANGTERVYWAANQVGRPRTIINVQGDEPLITGAIVDRLIRLTQASAHGYASLYASHDSATGMEDPNLVKVVTDQNDRALYFSRSPIPYCKHRGGFKQHIGLYGFTWRAIERFVQWPRGVLEQQESLEQLRILEHGFSLQMAPVKEKLIGVDEKDDILRVEYALKQRAKGETP